VWRVATEQKRWTNSPVRQESLSSGYYLVDRVTAAFAFRCWQCHVTQPSMRHIATMETSSSLKRRRRQVHIQWPRSAHRPGMKNP
jgi:hypothetical protein